jgi:hypothetical protein
VAGSPIERSERAIAKLIFLLHQGVRWSRAYTRCGLFPPLLFFPIETL